MLKSNQASKLECSINCEIVDRGRKPKSRTFKFADEPSRQLDIKMLPTLLLIHTV